MKMLRIKSSTNGESFIKIGKNFCTTWRFPMELPYYLIGVANFHPKSFGTFLNVCLLEIVVRRSLKTNEHDLN